MAGRKPLPTRVKIARGNPGKRKLNFEEPKWAVDIPDCPEELNDDGRNEWARVSQLLEEQGLLTQVDRAALAAYCASWSLWIRAQREVKKVGMLVRSPSGYPMINPIISVANRAQKDMLAAMVEFGMTPSSRSRLKGKGDLGDDNEKDLADWFTAGRS